MRYAVELAASFTLMLSYVNQFGPIQGAIWPGEPQPGEGIRYLEGYQLGAPLGHGMSRIVPFFGAEP